MSGDNPPFRFPANGSVVAYEDSGPWHKRFQARTERPLESLDLRECFFNHPRMEPGDTITVLSYADNKFKRVKQYGVVMIVDSALVAGFNRPIGMWIVPIQATAPAQPEPKKAPEPLGLSVKKAVPGAGWHVVDAKGAVIEQFKTKAEADTYLAALEPKEKAA